ncbi:MAG: terminase small subunit protein [Bauldia sp.]|nr:terminase small subunit protein [Bauldia sp.]
MRPTQFSPVLAEAIAARLAAGESLGAICAPETMPALPTVQEWLGAHDAFREEVARAREELADRFAEEIVAIADDASLDYRPRAGGAGVVADHEHLSRSKLRVDVRKWLMAKLAPKKYGDRGDLGSRDNPFSLSARIERLIVDPEGAEEEG